MAYIARPIGFGAGEIVVTSRRVECLAGYFEEGTKVEIIGVSERGYDLQDEYGNRILETGFDSVKRIVQAEDVEDHWWLKPGWLPSVL